MNAARIALLGAAALLSLASASSSTPPPQSYPPSQGGYQDGCVVACNRYFDCRNVYEQQLRGQCVSQCQQANADQNALQGFGQMECEQVVQLVDSGQAWYSQQSPQQYPPSQPYPQQQPPPQQYPPPQQPYPQQQPPQHYPPPQQIACPSPSERGADPRTLQILTGAAWCSQQGSRVQLGRDGSIRLSGQTYNSGWPLEAGKTTTCWRLEGSQFSAMQSDGRWFSGAVLIAWDQSGTPMVNATGVPYRMCQ